MSAVRLQLLAEGMSPKDLYEEWQRLERSHGEATRAVESLYEEWKDVPYFQVGRKAKSWSDYSTAWCDRQVLAAWKELMYSAWVFSVQGCDSRFLPDEYTNWNVSVNR